MEDHVWKMDYVFAHQDGVVMIVLTKNAHHTFPVFLVLHVFLVKTMTSFVVAALMA
jgi:hypothetical protein